MNLGATAATGPTGPTDSTTITVICDVESSTTSNCNGIEALDTVVIGDGDTAYTVATGGVSNTGEGPSTITLLDEGVELPSIVLGTRIAERVTFRVVVSGDALLNPAKEVRFALDVTAHNATHPDDVDLIGTARLTYTIAAVEIIPSVERYARNLSDSAGNPTDLEVESTEYNSGDGINKYFKTGVSAKDGNEVEILLVLNAGNQGPQSGIKINETLSLFVEYLSESAKINNESIPYPNLRQAGRAMQFRELFIKDGDSPLANTPAAIDTNGSAHLTYKVKVSGGEPVKPVTYKMGTPWGDGTGRLPDETACWCEGPRAPAEYCVAEGWAVGRNNHSQGIQATIRENADIARRLEYMWSAESQFYIDGTCR